MMIDEGQERDMAEAGGWRCNGTGCRRCRDGVYAGSGPRTDSRRSSRRLDGSEEQRYNEQGCAKTAVPHVGSKDLMCRAA